MRITIRGSIFRYDEEEIEVTESVDCNLGYSAAEQAVEELAAKVARKLIAAAVA